LILTSCSNPIRNIDGKIEGWKKNIYPYPPIGSPDSGAYVAAGDLDRFLRAVQSGEFLSQELTEAFLSPHVDHNDKGNWRMKNGYCWWYYVEKDGKVVCYQKPGINPGASGLIRYFPEKDINVVLLSTWKTVCGNQCGKFMDLWLM
jgi:CubicO group peptidase (beta-lactamase class C family)